ncbi:MAG TPA: molybdenum cofactor biosynthesis protein MoaE [Cryobacterium sp.]|nr:molybdenum cofactor biosynthesis protein MoaE [Cryobacterium sp.]
MNSAGTTDRSDANRSESAINQVTTAPLDLAAHVGAVSTGSCGAVVTFIGQVRDHDPDAAGQVTGLDYSAHPDAGRILSEIVARFSREYPQVNLSVSHRIGHLEVGDLALVAAAASAHRAVAFEACGRLVETVKLELPIWKKQHEVDGSTGWVGLT